MYSNEDRGNAFRALAGYIGVSDPGNPQNSAKQQMPMMKPVLVYCPSDAAENKHMEFMLPCTDINSPPPNPIDNGERIIHLERVPESLYAVMPYSANVDRQKLESVGYAVDTSRLCKEAFYTIPFLSFWSVMWVPVIPIQESKTRCFCGHCELEIQQI